MQPRLVVPFSTSGYLGKGVMIDSGSFTDYPTFTPVVETPVTDQQLISSTLALPAGLSPQFFPLMPVSFNVPFQSLVYVGQFAATGSGARPIGTERLYNQLGVRVLAVPTSSPGASNDIPPTIAQAGATTTTAGLLLNVRVYDDASPVGEVNSMYAELGTPPGTAPGAPVTRTLHQVQLSYDQATGLYSGVIPSAALDTWATGVEGFFQAANADGAVAHGAPFQLGLAGGPAPDTSKPYIALGATGPINAWSNAAVSLNWSVSSQSPLSALNGCDPQTLTQDTAGTTLTCSATNANGTTTYPVTVQIDTQPPAIALTGRPTANANGWYNAAVTLTWTCQDSLSGPLAPAITQTLSLEGRNRSATATCADHAGNTASNTVAGLNIDETPPTTPVLTGSTLTNGATYLLGRVPPAPGCTATDALSGLASCDVTGYTTTLGTQTLTATATDNAGNTSTAQVSYTVAPAIVFRAASSASTSSPSRSLTIGVPAHQPGDLLLAQVTIGNGGSSLGTVPSGWRLLNPPGFVHNTHGAGLTQAIFYHVATGSEPASYTFGWLHGAVSAGTIAAYAGVNSAAPIAASSAGASSSSSTAITAPGLSGLSSGLSSGMVVIGFFGIQNHQASITLPSGETQRWLVASSSGNGDVSGSGGEEQVQVAGAIGARTATASSAGYSIGQLVALAPAP